jgi:hypothetical protein
MSGRLLQTDAFVLSKRPPSDAFQTFTLFSSEHGNVLALQRLPKKNASNYLSLDLFDEVALSLESSNQGSSWFIKDVRLLARPTGIGRSYTALSLASAFTTLIARNPVHEDSRAAVATLLRTALAAFSSEAKAEIVYFKSLYCFARDEGYPIKQHWFPTLQTIDRAHAIELLNQPLATQTTPIEACTRLTRHLENYLRNHTEILLD